MSLDPAYGSTPLPLDEVEYLLSEVRQALPHPISRIDIYQLEKGLEARVVEDLYPSILTGRLDVEHLISADFLRELHHRMFGKLWSWAGNYRRHELNIGVAPEQIQVELRNASDNLVYRWHNTDDWTAGELGMAVHAELVRVHPFADGNGRVTRLLADFVFLVAQGTRQTAVYDWNVDKAEYIRLIRAYTTTRDPKPLAKFIPLLKA